MKYNLEHLSQATQEVTGPIQDDEALFFYALIKVLRLDYILEIGGLTGYSAKNFLAAISDNGFVVTVEPRSLNPISNKHIVINKSAHQVLVDDIYMCSKIDLIFFDAHDEDSQLSLFHTLSKSNLINDKTILALHDTGTHPIDIDNQKNKHISGSDYGNSGYIHQNAERIMTNFFMDIGYSSFHLHIDNTKLPLSDLKYRHGLTILTKSYRLTT